MYISYSMSNGYLYAQLAESSRDGHSVSKSYIANLGRVLDKERGIYRNRERGVFTYDISPTLMELSPRIMLNHLKESGANTCA